MYVVRLLSRMRKTGLTCKTNLFGGVFFSMVGTWKKQVTHHNTMQHLYRRNIMKCAKCKKAVVTPARYEAGYETCKTCGEREARMVKWTVGIPYGKGAYQLIYDPEELKMTNQKEVRK